MKTLTFQGGKLTLQKQQRSGRYVLKIRLQKKGSWRFSNLFMADGPNIKRTLAELNFIPS